ncbi:MAG: FtsX-like permease family protein, partial [Acidobacteriota bacterium]
RVTSGFFAVMGVHPSRESHRRPARGGLRRDVAVSFEVRGQVPLAGGRLSARLRAVTPGLFQTLDIRLVRGRPFQESDSLHSLPVAIIDRDLAERLWPHSDALGHRLELWKQRTIVGVVEGIRTSGPRSEHRPMIYVPFQQHPSSQINFVIKTGGKPLGIAAQVKKEMKRLDPGQPLFGLQSMEEALSISVARDRFQGLLMALFGVSGLLLSCIGLYGVLAFNVTQRTPEMGVRMALGARPRDVFRLVVGQGIGLLLAGLAIGNLVSLGSTRLLSSLLYGVGTMDAGMFIAASLTLLLAGVLASAIPARRAARLDPASALRFE